MTSNTSANNVYDPVSAHIVANLHLYEDRKPIMPTDEELEKKYEGYLASRTHPDAHKMSKDEYFKLQRSMIQAEIDDWSSDSSDDESDDE